MIMFCILNFIVLCILSITFSNLSILIIGAVGLLLVIYFAKGESKTVFNGLTIIYIISIILMIILYYGYISQYGVPYYKGGSDDLCFEQYGEHIISQGYYMPNELIKESQFRFYSANGFIWIMSWIIRFSNILGGYHTITYRVLNIYFLIILGILVFKYFSRHYSFSEKQNIKLLYAITLFPNCQYISIHVFRDTLNILILFGIFYLWDGYMRSENKKHISLRMFLITGILTYVSYWLRAQNIIFIIAIILVNLFLHNKKLTLKNSIYFIIVALFGVVFYKYLNVHKLLDYFTKHYTEYILNLSDGFSRVIFSTRLFPYGIILRIAYGLISPIPVYILQFYKMFDDVNIFFDVLISIGVIAQIYLLPYLFRNIKRVDKVTIVFLIFFLSMVLTTFTFRHFISFYPFMAILIFREFFISTEKSKKLSSIVITIMMILGASVYLIIK